MKYLLISIKDLEDLIAEHKYNYEIAKDKVSRDFSLGCFKSLQSLYGNAGYGKEIDLSEDTIKTKGRELAIERKWNPDSLETKRVANEIINAYYQALRDLKDAI